MPSISSVSKPRLALRIALVGLFAVGLLVASQIRVRALPPPAIEWDSDLTFAAADQGIWESAPVAAEITVAGLSWDGAAPRDAWIRSSADGATWSPWTVVDLDDAHAPDPGTSEAAGTRQASGPVYVGEAAFVQYRVVDDNPDRLRAEGVETAGRGLSLAGRVELFWSGITFGESDVAEASPDQPTMITREEWGGDRCQGDDPEEPDYGRHVETVFVHHTATTNNYSEAAVPGIVYSICSYHVNTRGWKDIGYNFLIDRYGNVIEGRDGGVDQPVWAAHTEGFNYYSTGFSFIGSHDTAVPTGAAQDAMVELTAWKLDIHSVDPTGSVTLESLGGPVFEEGEMVTLQRISGHRDVKQTACPGWSCYALLDGFGEQAEVLGGPKIFGGWPNPDPVPGLSTTGYEPVVLPLRFTDETEWNLEITNESGTVVYSEQGTGMEATVVWDGWFDGEPAEFGDYHVSVVGTVADQPSPRPVDQWFRLGDYRPPFTDDEGLLHEDNIVLLADAGITEGCSVDEPLFCPGDAVTRAQMASFIARATGLEPVPVGPFDDVGGVHAPAVNAMYEAGITAGCSAGENMFCPDDPVTRGQMAAFLFRTLPDLVEPSQDYFDDDTGHLFEVEINTIAEAGVTLGCAERLYCPSETVTRAQMASFLARAFLGAEL